jgi:methylmalonyl-CoA mutase C-terminal domain/subunit
LRDRGAGDIIVIAGGVIPDGDMPMLKALGVADIFLQDTPPDAIVNRVTSLVVRHREVRKSREASK